MADGRSKNNTQKSYSGDSFVFRPMRRKKQILSESENLELIKSNTSGVLALAEDGGYSYAVPLSYAYVDNKIYFHCARQGHKLDLINTNNKVSFCIIDKDDVVPQTFTTHFKSVIVFGTISILDDESKKLLGLEKLVEQYSAGYEEKGSEEIKRLWNQVCVLELSIDHMTGKQAIELVPPASAK